MKRNSMILAASMLMTLPAMAQQYEVSGTVPANTKMVYLQNWQERTPDSVAVHQGTFKFTGDAQGKVFAIVAVNDEKNPMMVPVVLDGKVNVNLNTGKVSGNAENEKLALWIEKLEPLQKKLHDITQEYYALQQNGKEIPDSVDARINMNYEAVMKKVSEVVKACCAENQNYKFPALLLSQYASSMDKKDIIQIAETGKPVFMETDLLKQVKRSIPGWKKQMPGTIFTDLTMNNTAGQAHKLSEYVGRGKYVLIDFWASWCAPCRKSMPALKAVYEKYKNKNFEIVGLSFDEDKTAWVNAIKQMNLSWIHLSDLKGWKSIAGSTYGVNSIPATLLIGPDGRIIASGLHANELDEKLAELLK